VTDDSDRILRRFARSFKLADQVPDQPEQEALPVDELSRPGSLHDTPHGPLRIVENRLTTAWPYFARPVELLLDSTVTDNANYLKDERVRGFCRKDALFLDTETTGLSHGAGTVAFLIGLGWFEDNELVTQQLLLDDYDQEQAQLHQMMELLERFKYLVSYNGKAFDRSVLENRLVMHRFMDPREAHLRLMPHLDLLHLGRRIHGGLLKNHRLPTLERQILGFHRVDDISGEMVPQHYFQYMISGREEHIAGVLKHNYYDVLSLVYLAEALLETVNPDRVPDNPRLAANLGKLLFNAGYVEQAVPFLEAGGQRLEAGGTAETEATEATYKSRRMTTRLLARAYRKLNHPWPDFYAIWEALHITFPNQTEPLVELAKLAERKSRNPTLALEFTNQALTLAPDNEALHKRKVRLLKKTS
jgi:uncharacterized protein